MERIMGFLTSPISSKGSFLITALWNNSVVAEIIREKKPSLSQEEEETTAFKKLLQKVENTEQLNCIFENFEKNQKVLWLHNAIKEFSEQSIESSISIATHLIKEDKLDSLGQFNGLVELVHHRFHDRKSSNKENEKSVSRQEWPGYVKQEIDDGTFLTKLKNDMNDFEEMKFSVNFRDVYCGLSHYRRHAQGFKEQLAEDKVSMESYISISETCFTEHNLIRIEFMPNETIKFVFTWKPGMLGVLSRRSDSGQFFLSTIYCNRRKHDLYIAQLDAM